MLPDLPPTPHTILTQLFDYLQLLFLPFSDPATAVMGLIDRYPGVHSARRFLILNAPTAVLAVAGVWGMWKLVTFVGRVGGAVGRDEGGEDEEVELEEDEGNAVVVNGTRKGSLTAAARRKSSVKQDGGGAEGKAKGWWSRGQVVYPGGLTNLGNTCFMNSVLQSMASLPSLCTYVLERSKYHAQIKVFPASEQKGKIPMNHALYQLASGINQLTKHRRSYRPNEFMDALASSNASNRRLMCYEQQDAHELFQLVSGALTDEEPDDSGFRQLLDLESVAYPPTKHQEAVQHLKRVQAVIYAGKRLDSYYLPPPMRNPLTGLMASAIKCQTCKYSSGVRHEVFDNLSLAVPLGVRQVSLDYLLRAYMRPESIHDYVCAQCSLNATNHAITGEYWELTELTRKLQTEYNDYVAKMSEDAAAAKRRNNKAGKAGINGKPKVAGEADGHGNYKTTSADNLKMKDILLTNGSNGSINGINGKGTPNGVHDISDGSSPGESPSSSGMATPSSDEDTHTKFLPANVTAKLTEKLQLTANVTSATLPNGVSSPPSKLDPALVRGLKQRTNLLKAHAKRLVTLTRDRDIVRQAYKTKDVDAVFPPTVKRVKILAPLSLKATQIAAPPQCLCLHMQRSVFNPQSGRIVKNNLRVEFEEFLDIGPYLTAGRIGQYFAGEGVSRGTWEAIHRARIYHERAVEEARAKDEEVKAAASKLEASSSAPTLFVFPPDESIPNGTPPPAVSQIPNRTSKASSPPAVSHHPNDTPTPPSTPPAAPDTQTPPLEPDSTSPSTHAPIPPDLIPPYPHMYRLASVVLHYGSHESGHFIAYRRIAVPLDANGDATDKEAVATEDVWYRISDSNVDVVSLEEVLEHAAGHVYMLFYEKWAG